MDARIEKLLRRDANGKPLPLTAEEIKTFTRRFGADAAQTATNEILTQRKADEDAAKKEAKEAADRELAAKEAQAKIDAQKAENERLGKQTDAEAARKAAETQSLVNAQTHQTELNKIMEKYRGSGLGQVMTGVDALSPAIGVGSGYGVATNLIASRQDKYQNALNEQRKALADAFNEVDPRAPTATAEYQSIADAAKKQPGVVPKGGFWTRYKPYGATGAFMLAEGGLQRYLGSDKEKDPLYQDALAASGTANMGAGLTLAATGLKYADNPAVIPSADALRKIALAEQYAKKSQTEPEGPPEGPEGPPTREPYRGGNNIVARHMATDLGIEIPSDWSKSDVIDAIRAKLPSASPAQVQMVAAGIKGLDTKADPDVLRGKIGDFAKPLYDKGSVASILAALGIGTGLNLLSSDRSDAGPARDQSITNYRLQRLGLPNTLEDAANAASYFVPVYGQGKLGADIGTAAGDVTKGIMAKLNPPKSIIDTPPSPSRPSRTPAFPNPASPKGMADAARYAPALAEDANQRREMQRGPRNTAMDTDISDAIKQDAARRPEMSQAMVDRGTPPEKALPPYFDDLPKYEQDLVRSGKDPKAIASMLLPLVRAGVEEGNEGGDFHGGTPRYNRKLSALQQFYGGSGTAPLLAAANADADKAIASGPPASKPKAPKVASPTSAPASPPPPPMQDDDTTPPPPPLYAMGGSVRHILRRYVH